MGSSKSKTAEADAPAPPTTIPKSIPQTRVQIPVIENKSSPMATLQVGGTMMRNQAEIDRIIKDQEGLNMSSTRRMELSDQWKFYLGCEPIQRGMDAGFVLGSFTAAIAYYWPHNKKPARITAFWFGGFAIGMMGLPMVMTAFEISNEERMKKREGELFAKQRKDYIDGLKNNA